MDKDELFRKTEEMLHREPAVAVKIDAMGTLHLDGVQFRDFVKKMGDDALRLEIYLMRAIDKAEEVGRAREGRKFGR